MDNLSLLVDYVVIRRQSWTSQFLEQAKAIFGARRSIFAELGWHLEPMIDASGEVEAA
jgi:hypothetical protein